MKHYALLLATAIFLSGCSVTKEIKSGNVSLLKPIQTASQISEAGNSPEMDGILADAIRSEGVNLLPALPPGTRKQTTADVLVSYNDTWRWDFVTYLQSITIQIFDADSGGLLVSGQWADAPLHGYKDAGLVVRELITGMFANLRSNAKSK
jgi:hypothetical protein